MDTQNYQTFTQSSKINDDDAKVVDFPDEKDLEPHVKTAINTALKLSGSEKKIDAAMALEAAIIVSHQQTVPPAFKHLSELLSLDVNELNLDAYDDSQTLQVYGFDLLHPILAQSIKRGLAIKQGLKDRPNKTSSRILGREYIAAAILCTNDPSLKKLLKKTDKDVASLQDEWFKFGPKGYEDSLQDEFESWWMESGVPLPHQRSTRAGYLTETPDGEDRLGVKKEAEALAKLIADYKTKPPLSIGLLGDWGSGKSFFMNLIEEKIETLQGNSSFCENIAQIHFNAWHFSDKNLWASIVDQVFTGIWGNITSGETTASDTTREKIREKIKQAEGAVYEAENQLDITNKQLSAAEEEYKDLAAKLAVEKVLHHNLQEISSASGWDQSFDALKSAGWSLPSEEDISDIRDSLTQLRQSTYRIHTVFQVALGKRALKSAIGWLIGGLLVTGGVVWFANKVANEQLEKSAQFVGTVASLAAAVVVPLSKASNMVTNVADGLDEVVEKYNEEIGKNEELQKRQREFKSAEEQLKVAQERLKFLQEQYISMEPSRRLITFLEERASSSDYRSRQGIISLIRRDFEQLSQLMSNIISEQERLTKEKIEEGNSIDQDELSKKISANLGLPDGVIPIDRIVLYVDDLDRCSPEIVVQTLEAIHLLLALPLFMVVVAVDPRWLQRSLAVHYKELFSEEDQGNSSYRISTPQNYLEKIFQITFAISPMSRAGFSTYVDDLTRTVITPAEPETLQTQQLVPNGKGMPPDASLAGPISSESQPTPLPETERNQEHIQKELDESRALRFSDQEKAFLKTLHPLVSTPRLTKRLVNVYRLIKAGLDYEDLHGFASDEERYRPVLLLLAILFGHPLLAEGIFCALTEQTLPNRETSKFHEALEALSKEGLTGSVCDFSEISNPQGEGQRKSTITIKEGQINKSDEFQKCKILQNLDVKHLADDVEDIAPNITVEACETAVHNYKLARYSFMTGQVWHTWRVLGEIAES
jgi:hypothetical protein